MKENMESVSHWGMFDRESIKSSSNIFIARGLIIDDLMDMLPRYPVNYRCNWFHAFFESLLGEKMFYINGYYVRRFSSSEHMPYYDNVRFKRLTWYSRKYRRVCF